MVAVIFATSPLLAWLLYINVDLWDSRPLTNHGRLIDPPRPLGEIDLLGLDGAPLESRLLFGRWTLVHFADGACASVCLQNLYHTRQARIALNKDISRVQRLLVFFSGPPPQALPELETEHPDLRLATGKAELLNRLARFFEHPGEAPAREAQRIYLADPHGNLMMDYGPDDDIRGATGRYTPPAQVFAYRMSATMNRALAAPWSNYPAPRKPKAALILFTALAGMFWPRGG